MPYVSASESALRITNVAAFAPAFTEFAKLAGQTPLTAVTQSRPYPGTPIYTFEAGMIETAYFTVRSVHASGPIGPTFETE